jgi:hypothetical protein
MNISAKSQKPRIVFLIILSAIGLPYGIYLLSDYIFFTSLALETQGQVVARDGSNFTIQYTVEGQTFRIKHSLPSTKGMTGLERARIRPGATVSVLYDPSSPGDGRWNAHNWVWPLVVIVLSVICGLAGFFPDIARKPFGRGKDVAI